MIRCCRAGRTQTHPLTDRGQKAFALRRQGPKNLFPRPARGHSRPHSFTHFPEAPLPDDAQLPAKTRVFLSPTHARTGGLHPPPRRGAQRTRLRARLRPDRPRPHQHRLRHLGRGAVVAASQGDDRRGRRDGVHHLARASAASRICDEEIAYARNLAKRIVPSGMPADRLGCQRAAPAVRAQRKDQIKAPTPGPRGKFRRRARSAQCCSRYGREVAPREHATNAARGPLGERRTDGRAWLSPPPTCAPSAPC